MKGIIRHTRHLFLWMAAALLALPAVASDKDGEAHREGPPAARHVIHISVDGLRADAIAKRTADALPNMYRLRTEGAHTDNARTDFYRSNTLPNHTSQLTSRPVLGPKGHHWTKNSDPEPGLTLHANRGEYVASVFDVTHDHGLSTALYTTKSKFIIYDQSYDEVNGAPDEIGEDNGRDKIDRFLYEADSEELVDAFVTEMATERYDYAFVHLRDPDSAGHRYNWDMHDGSAYLTSVERVDRLVGRIMELVDTTPELAGNTVVILTSDHGGGGNWHNHGDASDVENYTIPFYVWGRGVPAIELYALNGGTRVHPGLTQPSYEAEGQPIRNGDAANLALAHLGLPPVPGSTINVAHDLRTYGRQPHMPALASDERFEDGESVADSDRLTADASTAAADSTSTAQPVRQEAPAEPAANPTTDASSRNASESAEDAARPSTGRPAASMQ